MQSGWQFDPDTKEHFLPVDENMSWKVYRTEAKDYALTLHNEDDGFGDDVEFFGTLKAAKAEAENRVAVTPP